MTVVGIYKKDFPIGIKPCCRPTDDDIIPDMFVLIPLIRARLMPVAGYAAVDDILPCDYYPLQPGQTTLTVYAYDRELQGPYAGGQINRGVETLISGVDQRNPANNERVMAGMSWFLPDQQQVILRFARDNDIDNGFNTSREILLRYQKAF